MNKSKVCQCPVCKKGDIYSFRNPRETEPYWEFFSVKIQCDKCGAEFNTVVLDEKHNLKFYEEVQK